MVSDFRTLKAWQKAHQLALAVYNTTAAFPRQEMYGLTSQMRRTCVSIPSNVAGGCGRGGDLELARFLQIALGPASELQYQLMLARDLGFCDGAAYERLNDNVVEVKRMLTALIRKFRLRHGQESSASRATR